MDDRLMPLMRQSYYLKNWMFRQPVERTWVERTFSRLDPGCLRAAIFTLCSSTIGAGVLALPYAVSKCGVILGVFLMLVISISFGVYYRVLVRVSQGFQSHSYLQLVEAYFGQSWKVVMEFFITISCTGVIASLQAILCESSLQLSSPILGESTTQSRLIFLLIVNTTVFFPLCHHNPQLTTWRYISILPLVSITYVLLVVLMNLPDTNWQGLILVKLDEEVLEAICIMFFSFDAAINIPVIYNELTKQSFNRMHKVIIRSLLLISSLYLLVGTVGYAAYSKHVPTIIILRGDEGWGMWVAQLLVVVNMIVEIPLSVYPVRLCMEQILLHCNTDLCLYRTPVTIALLYLPMCVVVLVPNTVLYFEVLGAVFTVVTAFVVPSKTYIVLLYWKFSNSCLKKVVLLLWTLVLVSVGVGCLILLCLKHIETLRNLG